MIRSLAAFLVACNLLVLQVDAMSLFVGKGGRTRPPDQGPFLLAESENAFWFDLVIDGEEHKILTDEKGKVIVDLKDLIVRLGYYDIALVPGNRAGSGEEAFFHLKVEPLKANLSLWSIVKDENELEEKDWYDEAFTDELSVIVRRVFSGGDPRK